jgi:hypothetical protein
MPEQLKLKFSKNTIEQINIYREAAECESKTDGVQVKFSPTQKEAIYSICKEHNLKASMFLREALDFYIDLFPFRNKIKRHNDFLRETLSRLS